MSKRLNAERYDTDKARHPHYLQNYEEYFGKLLDKEIRLLELGVYKGGSLLLWKDYFDKGLIVGLDLNPTELNDPSGRIRTYCGEQQDTRLLDQIAWETAPDGFDVIIDDCSHIGELTRISFWHLFENHLKPGGLYVIEDWSTGYWDSWFDGVGFRPGPGLRYSPALFRLRSRIARLSRSTLVGRLPLAQKFIIAMKKLINWGQFHSHDYGLVGFIKELVDECGMADITRSDFGNPPARPSKFKEMRISPGQVFIVKAPQREWRLQELDERDSSLDYLEKIKRVVPRGIHPRSLIASYRGSGFGFVDYPGANAYGVSLTSVDWIRDQSRTLDLTEVYRRELGWDDHKHIYGFVKSSSAASINQ